MRNKKTLIFHPLSYSGGSWDRKELEWGDKEGLRITQSLVHLVLVLEGLIANFVEKASADDGLCHGKGVTIGRGATVFKVALLLLADSPGDADAGTAVGNASRKVVDVGGFMESSQAPGIVQAPLGIVGANVVLVPLA